MRIVFILIGNSRRSNYLDGDTLRYGNGGGSGTDSSTIVVAEQLALHGHEVVVTSDKLEPLLEEEYAKQGVHFNAGKKVRDVYYTDINFTNIENKAFDVIISSLWFHDYSKLPITVSKAIIYWCHMQWIYGIGEITDYAKANNLRTGFVNISGWEKSMNQDVIDHAVAQLPNTISKTIPNPVMDDIINEVLATNPVKKKHKFVFHASWARGGNVAIQSIRDLKWPDVELHAFDYLMTIHNHEDSFFHKHAGVDKQTLFTHIAESEYFVYPLYTPYKDVHKDTFSCVVAEAIALGAVPVTYSLGALPENFEGYCAWLDFPAGADPEVMQKESLSKDETGLFTCTDNIVKKLNYLDSNPELKQKVQTEGKKFILDKLNANKVGNMWVEFITELTT
jgi:glycosyltransferase involved in cell wall biosynthesis